MIHVLQGTDNECHTGTCNTAYGNATYTFQTGSRITVSFEGLVYFFIYRAEVNCYLLIATYPPQFR